MSKLKAGEEVSMRKTKRVVESMVDLILEEEQLLIGMTSIKDYDEYTYNHSVNVSILSVALGQRIGLNKKALTELGIVALRFWRVRVDHLHEAARGARGVGGAWVAA